MPKVLIVTSMFLPYMAADMHRARHLAAELPSFGWDVELLVPGDSFQREEHFEPNSRVLSVDIPVHRAAPRYDGFFKFIGSRTLGIRAYLPLLSLGSSILRSNHFDLVYFSCSQFQLFRLGVTWRRKFGVPFIVDFQDPWYLPDVSTAHFKGKWKRRAVNELGRWMEPATLKYASGIVSVSRKYLEVLTERYQGKDWAAIEPTHQEAIPFAASARDLKAAKEHSLSTNENSLDTRTIVYTGAGGEIMKDSFRKLCRLIRCLRSKTPELLSKVRFDLYGTEPAVLDSVPTLTRIACEEGVSQYFSEFPQRISYLKSLEYVANADGLIVLGVNDDAYMPSKLFQYGLTGKPLLTCMKAGSVTDEFLKGRSEMAHKIHFRSDDKDHSLKEEAVIAAYLTDVRDRKVTDRRETLEEWLAPSMAERHAKFFATCIGKMV